MVKRVLISVILTLVTLNLTIYAQEFPRDEKTGKVIFQEVVEVPGVSKDELFTRAMNWFKSYYTNYTSVIQSKDKEKGEITGKKYFDLYRTNAEGVQEIAGMEQYTIILEFKDGKYRYQIYDIFLRAYPKEYIEEWLDDETLKQKNADLLQQIHDTINALIDNLKTFMATAPEETTDDW